MEHSFSKFEPRWNCGSDLNLPMCLASSLFSDICLADGTFGNSISSSIVRYCVCMSAWYYFKPCRLSWWTPYPKWSTGRYVMRHAIRISEHKSVKPALTNIFNISKSVKNWKQCQWWKVFKIWFYTLRNFIRFFLTVYLFLLCGKVIFEVFWNWKSADVWGPFVSGIKAPTASCPFWQRRTKAAATLPPPDRACLSATLPHHPTVLRPLPAKSPRHRS
jgi:hypothetical protein